MQEWFVANEIAGLPGLPTTERRTRDSLEKLVEGKPGLKRNREGTRGFEYHYTCLSVEAQSVLLERSLLAGNSEKTVIEEKSVTRKECSDSRTRAEDKISKGLAALGQIVALEPKKRELVEAKIALVRAYDDYLEQFEVTRSKCAGERAFIENYDLLVPDWIRKSIPSVSISTIKRAKKGIESHKIAELAGNYKSDKKSVFDLNTEMANFVLALITAKPHFISKPKTVKNAIQVKINEGYNWPNVSNSSVSRHLSKLTKTLSAELAYATNPKEYNNSHRPIFAEMYSWITGPNQVWELDSTPTDVQLNVAGKARRYSVIGAIDVFTRRMKVVLMPSSSSEGICLLLRKCLLEWGIPQEGAVIRTDNGSDYVSKTTTGLFSMLGLSQSRAKAFSGWEKPFIERAFKTMSHSLMEKLPAYVGHDVADKKRLQEMLSFAESIGAKRKERDRQLLEISLTPERLQAALDDWLEFDYHHQPHEGLNKRTPFEVYSESGYRPQLPENSHSLDILLNYVGTATVVRGGVSAMNVKFTSPELMEPIWDRRKVRVFLDPSDVGRATLYPLDSWDMHVEAVNIDLIGRDIDPAMFRESRREAAKTLRKFKQSAAALQKDFGIDDLAALELAQKKLANSSLVAFNKTEVDINNPAISALSKTATVLMDGKKERTWSEAELKAIEARRQSLEQQRAAQARREENLSEQSRVVLRTEHEQAEWLTRESLVRDLSEVEKTWLIKFRNTHVMTRKRLDRILEESKRGVG
jgi:transposase InsO family protein